MCNEQLFFSDDAWLSRSGGKRLNYVGNPLKDDLSRDAVRKFVREKGVLIAMWSYDCDCDEKGPWYNYVCDTVGYNIDKIKSKNGRYYVRRSLKSCAIRPIDYAWLADNGYETYVNANSRYKDVEVESKDEFRVRMLSSSGVPAHEALGVFIDQKLVAYALVVICGQSVQLRMSHFDPAYSNSFPMYALYYTIAYYYLNERGYKEVDNGSRPLLHETNIGDFLLRLGWRKKYCRMGLYLVWPVRAILRVARVLRKACKLLLPSRHYARLESLLLAQDIAKATRKHDNSHRVCMSILF